MKIRNFLSKSSLRRKLTISYAVFLIVPLVVIASFSFKISTDILEKKTETMMNMTGDVLNNQYNNYFNDLNAISNSIMINAPVQSVLKRSVSDVKGHAYQNITEQNEISKYFSEICFCKPGISAILLYGDNGLDCYYSSDSSWNSAYDTSQEEWFQDTVKANGTYVLSPRMIDRQLFKTDHTSSEVVTFSKVIKNSDNFQHVGVLQIDIGVDYLNKLGLNAIKEGSLYIYNNQGDIILERSDHFDKKNSIKVESTSEFTKWKIIYYAPKDELLKEMKQTRNLIFLLTAITVTFAIGLAGIISSQITNPLQKLTGKIRLVAEGDFKTQITYKRKDEIGEVISGFNHMVVKINELIEEIHIKENQRLKTEIDALQARINPHFIYNTLNSIRLIAMMEGNNRITEIITSFVYLLKYASKNNGAMITLKNEISILEEYAKLMRVRYGNFSLSINCDDSLKRCLTIPFILQPIVENSIFHGIAPLGEKGSIEVDIEQNGGFIEAVVKDNGVGMSSETVDKIFMYKPEETDSFNSIGITNIRDRLLLHYGDSSSLTVKSAPGRGTEITIRWPKDLGGKE